MTAKTVQCRGCGGAIVSPGPRVVFPGVEGDFHVTCVQQAVALDEREKCIAWVRACVGNDAADDLRKARSQADWNV